MKHVILRGMLFFASLLLAGIANAQTVTGTVSEPNGPLPGANVLVKGTTNGTTTDFDGNYTLNNVPSDATLVFSYVGFAQQEVAVNGRSTVNVTLEEDAAALEEVVVIGYGTTTVRDATGSVSSVTAEEFNQGAIASPEQLIQGKTAGVNISQNSGEPGAGNNIRIRGSNSIRSNNNPLFVVDGIPLSGESTTPSGGDIINGANATRNPLNFINPNDIESISILKDASATAIYGSRGANGVVIVTTKSGRGAQGGVFEFSTNMSFSAPAREYDLFNAQQFLANTAELRGQDIANDLDFGNDTDWQDYITRSTISTNNNLSYSNNYNSGNIRATVSYGNIEGVIQNSSQERITTRLNANQRFFDDKLSFALQASYSRVNDEAPPISGQGGASGNLIGAAYSANPTWPADPEFFFAGNLLNPANYLNNYNANTETDRYLINLSTEYKFTDAITGKVSLGYDNSDAAAQASVSPNINNFNRVTDNGQASYNTLENTSKLLEATLRYAKEFDNFKIDALAGYSFQDFRRQGFSSQGYGSPVTDLLDMQDALRGAVNDLRGRINVPYQQFGYDSNGANTFLNSLVPFDDSGVLPSFTGVYESLWLDTFDNTDELQSYFARLQFTFSEKYLLTATMRADGSSRFGGNNKYGYFPSAAFAWQLGDEDFIGDAFSTLKLRIGAGSTGNQEGLGYAQYLNRQRFGGPGITDDGTVNRPGLETVAVQNPDLKWESTIDLNFGIDFGFNNDRLNGSLDLYRKATRDLLFRSPAPAPAFDPFRFVNLEDGEVINKGVELALNYDFIQTEDVNFSASFNISYNHNEVTGLNGAVANFGEVNGPGLTGAFVQRLGEGRSLFSYYMAEYAEDANGNPNFSADDKDFVGKDALPDWNTGLSLNLSVKNWDFSTFFTGQFGFYVYNNTANAFLNRPTFLTSRNATPDGLALVSQEVSTLYLESGDFVRLQNASVGYNIPMRDGSAIQSLRVNVTGQNLLLITGYSGLDPEVSSSTGDFGSGIPSAGIDYTSFPRPTTVTVGLNARF
ncbi:SusC/RagA family TonB-linked outer membrane protein [Leeuwenhoekiella nanhaiensis]|uniref:SusC/RagA family TonB-linked outer membrane protein n=1 Tax=Leeuwenhoekiella nanhaiensis TaxID=1655491 RepID=A0A2G1VP22_9FLAO|nr:SusC/RagA family TonB-linked outer membrane protein [Leeuwenhoekiella nanhaiensis]PHQ28370.1 SusC/RagA family TonB-linked outer membrane protein [Leeuwenhoekiella nanhaiensis]